MKTLELPAHQRRVNDMMGLGEGDFNEKWTKLFLEQKGLGNLISSYLPMGDENDDDRKNRRKLVVDNAKFTPFHFNVVAWCLLVILSDGYDLAINGVVLSRSFCDITDEDLLQLSQSPYLSNLTEINLIRNEEIADKGVGYIAESPYLRQLDTLVLSDLPCITDNSITSLLCSI